MSKISWAMLVGFLVLAGCLYAVLSQPFQWTRGIEQSRGPFFRVDVKLTYKGEPLDISFEVACAARITRYADNSSSHEVGLTPNLFGYRMKDNHAVVVRPPKACRGQTTQNGKVPLGHMPVVIVYDNADTLAFGEAYLADDAYESPYSQMTFISATVTASNLANWLAFREAGPKNVVVPERWYSKSGTEINVRKAAGSRDPIMGAECRFAKRLLFNPEVRPQVAALPSFVKGGYWVPKDHVEGGELLRLLRTRTGNQLYTEYDTKNLPEHLYHYKQVDPDVGVPRRHVESLMHVGSGIPKWSYLNDVPSIYPLRGGLMSADWPTDPKLWDARFKAMETNPLWSIEFDNGRRRGFGYCWDYAAPFPFAEDFKQKLTAVRGFMEVDGQRVANPKPDLLRFGQIPPIVLFEHEAYIDTDYIYLSSYEGGV